MNQDRILATPRGTVSTAGSQRRLASRRLLSAGIWAVAVSNAAIIVWIWAANGNVIGLHSTGDLLSSIGRVTGLLSAYLALIQVLLLARLRPLERIAGFDRLTVWHRWNGKICLGLVAAHVVFITIGYALNDQISVPHEATVLLTTYPGMMAATVGTALMILIVGVSLVIVRRRMRYELWYLVHISAYAAIALAWFHQIPTGNELILNAAAANYWTSLYVVTLGLVLCFRVAVPTFQAFRYRLTVAETVEETSTVVSLHLVGRGLDRLKVKAGQFFLWRFLDRGRWWEAHPFSVSAAPDGRSLRITVKNSGDFSAGLRSIEIGTRVVAEGPFGVFTTDLRRRERVAFIAGGIGITPIRAMLEEMAGGAVLIYRVLRDDDVALRGELDALARQRDITIHYVIGHHLEAGNERLLSADHLVELVPDIATRDVFLCGPPAMMDVIEKQVRAAGVPRSFIHTERFAL